MEPTDTPDAPHHPTANPAPNWPPDTAPAARPPAILVILSEPPPNSIAEELTRFGGPGTVQVATPHTPPLPGGIATVIVHATAAHPMATELTRHRTAGSTVLVLHATDPLAAIGQLLTDLTGPHPQRQDPRRPPRVTDKEAAIIDLVCRGRTVPQISNQLGVSVNTVKTQLQRLYKRLGVNSMIALVVLTLTTRHPEPRPLQISTTEADIIGLLCDDLTDPEIADRLNLNTATVQTLLRHMYGRFKVRGRIGLVALALRTHSIGPRPQPVRRHTHE